MQKCNMGYQVEKDNKPSLRCHYDGKYEIENCKECSNYNHKYDLVLRAIESAKCRIYKLQKDESLSMGHQIKAKNQGELMNITIEALEFYLDTMD